MGFRTSSSKSKRYRGPAGNFLSSKGFISTSAASIAKRKISDAIQLAARTQRRLLALYLLAMKLNKFSSELSQSELTAIQTLRDPPGQDNEDWEMADDALGDVLDGHQLLNISHEGGEFEALADLEKRMRKE